MRAKAIPASSATARGLDVEVVEDLQVVGRRSRPGTPPPPVAPVAGERPRSRSRTSGPSHASAVRPALCHATDQRVRPAASATAAADSCTWSRVGIAAVDEARRDAVGGEEDRRLGPGLGPAPAAASVAAGRRRTRVAPAAARTRGVVPVVDHLDGEGRHGRAPGRPPPTPVGRTRPRWRSSSGGRARGRRSRSTPVADSCATASSIRGSANLAPAGHHEASRGAPPRGRGRSPPPAPRCAR